MAGAIKGIKIEFDGDTSKLSKSIKTIESESRGLSKQISQVNKSLKFDGGNVELLAQKMDLVSRSAAAAGADVQNLKELQGKLDSSGVDKSSEAYRKLEQEIAIAESKQKSFKQQFEDSLQTAPIEALDREYQLLEEDIAANEEEIKQLEAEMQKLDGAGTEEAQKKYEELQRKLEATKQKNVELREDMDKIDAAKGARQAADDVEDLGDAMEDAADAAEEAGAGLQSAQGSVDGLVSVLAGAGLVQLTKELANALMDCVSTSANFDSAMSQVAATMGVSVDSISNMADAAKEMGSTTQYSAKESAEALNYLALAGYDAEKAVDTLPTVLNLAAAGSMSLASASDMVTDAMSALGISTNEADKFVDQMAKTASSSNTSVEQLGEALLTIGATGKSAAGGTSELNTELGLLANVGIKGSEAGTHLRNMFLSLQNPTEDAAALLNEYTNGVYDAQGNMRNLSDILGELAASMEDWDDAAKDAAISDIFNKTDLASAKALLGSVGEEWDNLTAAIENSQGAASEMADTQMDNLNGSITELESATEGLKIAIGDQLTPAMTVMTDAATGAISGLTELVSENEALVPVVGGVASAFGLMTSALVALTAAQKVYNALKASETFMSMLTPVGLVTTAIGALGAGITVAISDWQRIQRVQAEAASESEVAAQKYEETVGAIGENQENVAGLCARLDELTSKTSLSASEQEEAKQIVNELNGLIPDLGLSYDELANSINMSTDAIIANAKAAGNQEQITALEEKITETWKEQQEVAADLAEEKEELTEAEKAYQEALAAQEANTDKSIAAQTEYADAVNDAKAELEDCQATVDATQAYYDELGQTMEDDANTIKELSGEMTEATDSTEDLGNAAVKTSEEMEAEAEAAKEATQAVAKIGLACYEASGSGDELMEQFEELSKEFEANKENCDAATAAIVEQRLAQLELAAMTQQLKEQLPLLGSGYEQLAASLKASGYSVDEYVASYQETFSNVVSGFDELKYNTEQGLNDWVAAMDKRVEIQEKWNGNIETLVEAANGASTIPWVTATPEFQAAVQTMMDGGMETYGTAAEELAALVEEGNANAVLEVCNGITEAGAAAQQAAKNEFAMQTGLTMEAIDSMLQSGAATIEGDKVVIQDAAAAAAAGVPDGMLETQEETDAAVQTLVSSAADAVLAGETEMAYENSGKALMQYMINGIKAKQSQVTNAIKAVLQSAAQSAKTYAQSQGKDVGYYFDVGLANGIRTNKSLVYDAAYEVAAEASTAARNAIKVESPSKVAMEIGEYFSEGMAIGITNGQDMVAKASAAMADSAAVAASSGTASAATTNNYEGHNIEIVVNAARGQDANQIADAVMDKINSALIRTRGARRL